MTALLLAIDDLFIQEILKEPSEFFDVIMGIHPENVPFESMLKLWIVTSRYISQMYKQAVKRC